MRLRIRKIMAILLAVVMVSMMIPFGTALVSALNMTLQQLQSKFPAGKYWNHVGSSINNPDGYTSTPCYHHGSCDYYGSCGCNNCGSAVQCFGFANKLAYDAYGSYYTSWSRTSLNKLKAGDVIRYKNDKHSIFVTGVNGDTITYGDCNSDGHCIIRWNVTISKTAVAATLTAVYSAPSELSTFVEPDISYSVDLNDGDSICGTDFPITGKVIYGGKYPWLHLYVDYGWVADTANNSEGNYAFYLDTTKYSSGEHLIGIKITNDDGLDFTTWRKVIFDNSKPSVSVTYLAQISDDGYRICCKASDNVGIAYAKVATWTKSDQSDLIWHDCYYNGADTYFYDCKRSDFAVGATKYFNHMYIYDYAGNSEVGVQVAEYSDSYSLIKTTYYSEIKQESFRLCCTVNDSSDIEKVQIATWTTGNQSDLVWQDCYYNGSGTYFCDLNRSDYRDGASKYISHVYVYSRSGVSESIEEIFTYKNNPPDVTICGDTNLDGEITISDLTEIQKHLAGIIIFSKEQENLADTNGDGHLDISDAVHLQKFLAGFEGVILR